mmetsp:Transcript_73140/g.156715  ORF Transcript_73140/g.156715 Transcript_73140/m.156715 type:complete len:239 (+) Transcript_73140:14-730(+)
MAPPRPPSATQASVHALLMAPTSGARCLDLTQGRWRSIGGPQRLRCRRKRTLRRPDLVRQGSRVHIQDVVPGLLVHALNDRPDPATPCRALVFHLRADREAHCRRPHSLLKLRAADDAVMIAVDHVEAGGACLHDGGPGCGHLNRRRSVGRRGDALYRLLWQQARVHHLRRESARRPIRHRRWLHDRLHDRLPLDNRQRRHLLLHLGLLVLLQPGLDLHHPLYVLHLVLGHLSHRLLH